MEKKIKSHVKRVLLFCLTLALFSCQNEEHSSDQLQSKIETVPINEAKDFLMHSKSSSSAKSTNNELDNVELDEITQERIKGSDQLLTVIPFKTNSKFENKRILLLKINNEIKSIAFSMYPDENSFKGSFSGKIFSHTLDGNFITGFRAENGIIVSQFVENNNAIKTDTENAKTSKLTSRSAEALREVILQNNYRKTVHALDMFGSTGMYGDGIFGGGIGNSGGRGYSWDVGDGGNSSDATTIYINIEGKKIDPKEETKCFDKSKSAVLTIYIQQPNENTRDKMGANSVGHTFVGIQQGGIQRVLGFYPDSPNASLISSQNSELHDNSNTLYHVSISIEVDAVKLVNIINYINSYPKTYDLNNYNCSDFAIGAAAKGGLNLPKTTGTYDAVIVNFKGRNPGDLGQDIRNMSVPNGATISATKGNAPKKKGGC
ncbi:hypothetical protein [Flavobacterium sp. N502540]|uniref:hypothetical protein n=1 Tax=Flavobacterium sp. N502540 TaxID=2986838 RepID=UPI0022242821|nr:hypothetical protein [Flavobacterium sp. N502540]